MQNGANQTSKTHAMDGSAEPWQTQCGAECLSVVAPGTVDEPTIDSSQIIDISHPLAIQHIDSLPIKETSSQPRLFTGTGNSVDIPTSGQIKVIHDK